MYWKNKSIITGLPIEMSIWADMHRRSNGVQERKENKVKVWDDEITWPQVTKIYGKIIASNIVSAQPMSEPIGELFYFDP